MNSKRMRHNRRRQQHEFMWLSRPAQQDETASQRARRSETAAASGACWSAACKLPFPPPTSPSQCASRLTCCQLMALKPWLHCLLPPWLWRMLECPSRLMSQVCCLPTLCLPHRPTPLSRPSLPPPFFSSTAIGFCPCPTCLGDWSGPPCCGAVLQPRAGGGGGGEGEGADSVMFNKLCTICALSIKTATLAYTKCYTMLLLRRKRVPGCRRGEGARREERMLHQPVLVLEKYFCGGAISIKAILPFLPSPILPNTQVLWHPAGTPVLINHAH